MAIANATTAIIFMALGFKMKNAFLHASGYLLWSCVEAAIGIRVSGQRNIKNNRNDTN